MMAVMMTMVPTVVMMMVVMVMMLLLFLQFQVHWSNPSRSAGPKSSGLNYAASKYAALNATDLLSDLRDEVLYVIRGNADRRPILFGQAHL